MGTTILQTQTVAESAVGWSVPLDFRQFNPLLGALSNVGVGIVGNVSGVAAIENLGASAATVQINLPGAIEVAAPDGSWLAGVDLYATKTLNLGAYDGTANFVGTSGTVVAGISSSATVVSQYVVGTSTDTGSGSGVTLPVEGTGSLTLTASSQASSNVVAYGNLLSLTEGNAGATVSVQYGYAPSSDDDYGSDTESVNAFGIEVTGTPWYYPDQTPVVLHTTAVQTLRIADTTTGWNTTVAAAQFNPALGVLESVNLTVIADVNAGLAVENLGTSSASIGLTETADITLTLPNGMGVVTADPSISNSTILAGFDGAVDFAGPSGEDVTGLTDTQVTPSTFTDYSELFVGTGTIALPIAAISPSTLTGPADLAAELLTQAGATVEISYTYYVPNPPTPPFQFALWTPAISGTEANQAVTDRTTVTPFFGVAISDGNVAQTETVTVALSAAANGILTNLGGGSYNATTGIYTDTGSALAVTADLQGLVFDPTTQEVAGGYSVTTGFTISDIDTAGVSTTDSTASVIATAVAAGLTISGTAAGQGVTDQTTVAPFANALITDPSAGQTESVTVTLSAAANGTLSGLGGGSYDAVTGVYTDAGSATAVTAALQGLVFTPTAVAPGQTVTTGFTLTDTDSAGVTVTDATTSVVGTAGVYIDTAAAAAEITAELGGLAHPPTISGAKANQAMTDQTTIAPFSGVVIGDANSGQTEVVTVKLSAAANGTLSNLGGGSYNPMTAVYTDTGSAAAVTKALDGLEFKPTGQEVAAGHTVTTAFTVTDTDTAGGIATNTTSSVIATAAGNATGGFESIGFIHNGFGGNSTDTTPGGGTDSGTGWSLPGVGTGVSGIFSSVGDGNSGGNVTTVGIPLGDFGLNVNSNGSGYTGVDLPSTAAGQQVIYPVMTLVFPVT
jgi:hypothetical protein